MNRRKTEEDYYEIAKAREFKWVGEKLPKNVTTNTGWKCKFGHEWFATYHAVSRGDGCPYCAGTAKKVEKDYCNLAERRGFIWLDKVIPKNIKIKTLWRCEQGHEWSARYNDIQQGQGCPYCSGNIRKIDKDYYSLANSKGFNWVGGKLPDNIKIKTLWECKNGHKWSARYSDIHKGSGCPYCKNYINGVQVSNPQIELNKLVNGYLNYPEARYRIDVAIIRNSQKIAVEYDAYYWHSQRKECDTKRDVILVSKGWKVLHVRSGKLLPTRKQLKKAIKELLNGKDIVNIYLEDWKV